MPRPRFRRFFQFPFTNPYQKTVKPESQLRAVRMDLDRLEDRTVPAPFAAHTDHPAAGPAPLVPQQFLFQEGGFLTGPSTLPPLMIARDFLTSRAGQLELEPADVADPILTDSYTDTDSAAGTTHVYFQQQHNGLKVLNATIGVHVNAAGHVVALGGGFVPGLGAAAAETPAPKVTAHAALNYFAATLDFPRLPGPIQALQPTKDVTRSEIFHNPAFSLDPIPVNLTYVYTDAGTRLGWELIVRTTDRDHWFNAVVDAQDGRVQYVSDWIDDLAAYNAFPFPIESPQDGGRVVTVDPADPAASPFGWHDTNGAAGPEFTDTRGNNVVAQEDVDANNTDGFRPSGGPGLLFNFPLDLTAAPSTYPSAAITNLFVSINLLHDVHQRYGFTEAAGNFQTTNYTGAGKGNDAVIGDAQDGSGTNNANFGTPPDGSAPRMQQFIWTSATPSRDSDFDNGVVAHEFGHGVSNRLTGGPANSNALNTTQSGGMGEGWGDWWALMLTQRPTDTQNAAYPIGTYLLNQAPTAAGIRRYPYSYNMTTDPLTWDYFGTSGSVGGVNRSTAVHFAGTIWASALWDMNWLLINKYGFDPDLTTGYTAGAGPAGAGNKLALQLVMDALKLQPANPSFIDARNAILTADVNLTGGANQREIWTAFARRQLGFGAATADGNATTVTLSAALPAAADNPAVIAQSPAGVTAAAPGSLTLTFSKAMDTTSFNVAADVVSFTGPGGTNLLPQITGFTWTTSSTLQINFTGLTAQGWYALTLAPSVLAGGVQLDQDLDNTPGETADRYTAHFAYDAVTLAVGSTTPANNTAVAPGQPLDVTFSEPVDPATVDANDVRPSQGTVTGVTIQSPTTVRYTISGTAPESSVYYSIKYGAVLDAFGFPVQNYNGSYFQEGGAAPFPTPLTQLAPAGSRAYQGTVTADVGVINDADPYTLALDAGSRVSVVLTPDTALRGVVEVRDSANALVATATATAAGAVVVTPAFTVPANGAYTITALGTGATAGSYTLRVLLNAAPELELTLGTANNTRATAQSLDTAFVAAGPAQVAAAVGRIEAPAEIEPNNTRATATDASATFAATPANTLYQLALTGNISTASNRDWFNIGALQVGDVITVSLSGSPSARGTNTDPYVELWRAGSGSAVTVSDDDGPGTDSLIYRFTVATADTYYVSARSFSTGTGTYQLGINLENTGTAPGTSGNTTTETEANDTLATANDVSTSWRQVQYVSTVTGTITAGDTDYFSYPFTAGDRVTVVAAPGTLPGAKVSLYNPAGTAIASEDGSSAGPNGASPIYAYLITTTGTYSFQVSAAAGTGAYSAQVSLSGTAPPARAALSDFYSITLAANQTLSLAAEQLSAGTATLVLQDSTGAVVASGAATATNVDRGITNFVAPAAGVYYAVVSDTGTPDYTLTAVKGGTFDLEANDSFAAAQPLAVDLDAVGAITASNDDWYRVTVTAAGGLRFSTTTPGDGPGEFVNTLNPRLELYNPAGVLIASDDNSAADGRNAVLNYTFTAAGDYRVRVQGTGATIGEYALATTDLPPALANPIVIDDGSTQRSVVRSITLTFTEPVSFANLPTDAFTLTRTGPGAPTTVTPTVTVVGATITLTFPALTGGSLADGDYSLVMNPNQILDAAGNFFAPGAATTFHRLFGDADGNRQVDFLDLAAFRPALGSTSVQPAYRAYFDYDNNLQVDFLDLAQFRSRLGTILP